MKRVEILICSLIKKFKLYTPNVKLAKKKKTALQ